mmetsp:Transcript_81348/g.188967  ORF Transcript_81348/g.188967 Transcript_81348/m.188967 type:complete len:165 (-) Transcript_81348:121-615(-)
MGMAIEGAGVAATPAAVLPPDGGSQDNGEDEALPFEQDAEAWLELLRDGFVRQLREENDYPEPPPFHRAIHFAASPGEPIPPGKFPRQALNTQLQLLLRTRATEGLLPGQKGAKGQPLWIPTKGGARVSATTALAAGQPGDKGKSKGRGKVWTSNGVQRTIGKQ